MGTRQAHHNRRTMLSSDGPYVRVNITLPRDLLAQFKAHLDGRPLSTELQAMMAKAIETPAERQD